MGSRSRRWETYQIDAQPIKPLRTRVKSRPHSKIIHNRTPCIQELVHEDHRSLFHIPPAVVDRVPRYLPGDIEQGGDGRRVVLKGSGWVGVLQSKRGCREGC